MGKEREHYYDSRKAWEDCGSSWWPALCGTRVCRGWFPYAQMQKREVDCLRCLRMLKQTKPKRRKARKG